MYDKDIKERAIELSNQRDNLRVPCFPLRSVRYLVLAEVHIIPGQAYIWKFGGAQYELEWNYWDRIASSRNCYGEIANVPAKTGSFNTLFR